MTANLVTITKLADLPVDTNKAFRVQGKSVLMCRTDLGVYAVENRCTHQQATLEGGRMRGVHLFCPKHSARFDMRTGATVGQLAKEPIKTYVTHVDADGNIQIEWHAPPTS